MASARQGQSNERESDMSTNEREREDDRIDMQAEDVILALTMSCPIWAVVIAVIGLWVYA